MSHPLIARSPDLQRLREEGYELEIRGDQLLLAVPYATSRRTVARGWLVSTLTLAGDRTTTPDSHTVHFIGAEVEDYPHDDYGQRLDDLIHSGGPVDLGGDGLTATCMFSHKPQPTYPDYHAKMSTYADMLVAYAQALDPAATAKTFPPLPAGEHDSVFRYLDTASTRARISAVTDRLRLHKVAIVGLGGTGSYILDCVAKTPVASIHLFDGDVLLTHNAFRSPGAATLDDLRAAPAKVNFLQATYDAMHRNIIAHPCYVDDETVEQLRDADFVFVAIDGGPGKRSIVEKLQEFGVPFVDTGMGVYQRGSSLGGVLRTTASTPRRTDHVWEHDRIPFTGEGDDEYDQNIQIADLNMLNAALAVIKWKKLFGFYVDLENEFSNCYTIDGNHLLNEDRPA